MQLAANFHTPRGFRKSHNAAFLGQIVYLFRWFVATSGPLPDEVGCLMLRLLLRFARSPCTQSVLYLSRGGKVLCMWCFCLQASASVGTVFGEVFTKENIAKLWLISLRFGGGPPKGRELLEGITKRNVQ